MRRVLSLILLTNIAIANANSAVGSYGEYFSPEDNLTINSYVKISKEEHKIADKKNLNKKVKDKEGYIEGLDENNEVPPLFREIDIKLFNANIKKVFKVLGLLYGLKYSYVSSLQDALRMNMVQNREALNTVSGFNLGSTQVASQENQGSQGQGQVSSVAKAQKLNYALDDIYVTFVYKGPLMEGIKKLCNLANIWCEYDYTNDFLKISKYKVFYFKLPEFFDVSLKGGGQNNKISYSSLFSKIVENLQNFIADGEIYIDDLGNLVLVTRPRDYKKIKSIIDSLQSKKKLKLKIRIVRVDINNEAQSGIDWSSFLDTLNTKISLTSVPQTLSQGVSIAFNSKDFNTVIKALDQYGKVETIKTYSVSTLSNQLITFSLVDNVPVITTSSTTDEGTTTTSTNVEFKEVGLKLGILPMIMNDKVFLNIYSSLSSVKDIIQTQDSQIPVISTNDVYIPYIISPGKTVLVSLYEENNKGYTYKGIPLFEKLPILNKLFGYTDNKKGKTEILLFITPEIEK